MEELKFKVKMKRQRSGTDTIKIHTLAMTPTGKEIRHPVRAAAVSQTQLFQRASAVLYSTDR